jgi:hypothetical protein
VSLPPGFDHAAVLVTSCGWVPWRPFHGRNFGEGRIPQTSPNGLWNNLIHHPTRGPSPDGITREKGREGRFLPDRLLQNITGLTLTVNDAERNRLVQEFRAYSYRVNVSGERVTASSPDVTFAFLPSKPRASRILTVDMSLTRPAGEQNIALVRAASFARRATARDGHSPFRAIRHYEDPFFLSPPNRSLETAGDQSRYVRVTETG